MTMTGVPLKVAFDTCGEPSRTVPGERIVHSRSLYQPSSRRDVGCHLCFRSSAHCKLPTAHCAFPGERIVH